MTDNLSDLSDSAIQEINKSSSSNELELVRVRYLGKKGSITGALKSLSEVDPKEEELLNETTFYKNYMQSYKAIHNTIKASFSTLGADIAEDGDIDTDKLIGFLIVTLSLPFFFLVIEFL